LSESEIEKMVKDAEDNAAEDHRKVELVQARNHADAMAHSVKKSLAEHGKELADDERAKVEAAIKDVEEALKGDDKDAISAKTEAMMAASHKLSEKMYADVQKAAAAQGNTEAARPANDASEARAGKPMDDDNVVDAEIKEVKKG
jgi:molecular chaperone DnaK